jgi:hypothetical protein
MKRQLFDSKIWMIINKRANLVPMFERVEIVQRDYERIKKEIKREKDFS